jgi:hypothetical protein
MKTNNGLNTVDTYKRSGKITIRESTNATRIKSQMPASANPDAKFLSIKKKLNGKRGLFLCKPEGYIQFY